MHRCRYLGVQRGHEMRVGIERETDRGVSEHLADPFGVATLSQQQGRRGVPQIVEADHGQIVGFEGLLKDLALPAGVRGTAVGGQETRS